MTSSLKKRESEREGQSTEIRYVRRVGWVVPRGFSRQKEARDDRADLLTPGNIVLVED